MSLALDLTFSIFSFYLAATFALASLAFLRFSFIFSFALSSSFLATSLALISFFFASSSSFLISYGDFGFGGVIPGTILFRPIGFGLPLLVRPPGAPTISANSAALMFDFYLAAVACISPMGLTEAMPGPPLPPPPTLPPATLPLTLALFPLMVHRCSFEVWVIYVGLNEPSKSYSHKAASGVALLWYRSVARPSLVSTANVPAKKFTRIFYFFWYLYLSL